MRMSEHTKGRLTFRELAPRTVDDGIGYIEDADGRPVSHHGDHAFPAEENRANGRRLVACWNACEHLSTESLELMHFGPQHLAAAMLHDRDELLAALRGSNHALKSAIYGDVGEGLLKGLTAKNDALLAKHKG